MVGQIYRQTKSQTYWIRKIWKKGKSSGIECNPVQFCDFLKRNWFQKQRGKVSREIDSRPSRSLIFSSLPSSPTPTWWSNLCFSLLSFPPFSSIFSQSGNRIPPPPWFSAVAPPFQFLLSLSLFLSLWQLFSDLISNEICKQNFCNQRGKFPSEKIKEEIDRGRNRHSERERKKKRRGRTVRFSWCKNHFAKLKRIEANRRKTLNEDRFTQTRNWNGQEAMILVTLCLLREGERRKERKKGREEKRERRGEKREREGERGEKEKFYMIYSLKPWKMVVKVGGEEMSTSLLVERKWRNPQTGRRGGWDEMK